MGTQPPPVDAIVLYGAEGCHLCDGAREAARGHLAARAAAGRRTADLVEVDIHADERLLRTFMVTIPVLAVGGRRLELATSPARVRAFLDAALDGPGAEVAPTVGRETPPIAGRKTPEPDASGRAPAGIARGAESAR